MSDDAHPQDERSLAEGPDAPEAGVPAELLDLYIDCELEAHRRGVDVDVVLEEIRALAGGAS